MDETPAPPKLTAEQRRAIDMLDIMAETIDVPDLWITPEGYLSRRDPT